MNEALYLVATEKDSGASRRINAEGKYGVGHCDAHCPHDMKWISGEARATDNGNGSMNT